MINKKITKISTIVNFLTDIFPNKDAEKWDNCQLLNTRFISQPIKSIMVGLDLLHSHLEDLIHSEANLVITHHPLWIKQEDIDEGTKLIKKILREHKIVFLSLHTQFDINPRGTNYQLIKQLDLCDMDNLKQDNHLMYATLKKPLLVNELINQLKQRLHLDFVKFSLSSKIELITKLAFCAGSGYDLVKEVDWNNADVFITGDLKYHDWTNVERNGYNIIDIGHEVEKVFENYLKSLIESNFELKVNCLTPKTLYTMKK